MKSKISSLKGWSSEQIRLALSLITRFIFFVFECFFLYGDSVDPAEKFCVICF